MKSLVIAVGATLIAVCSSSLLAKGKDASTQEISLQPEAELIEAQALKKDLQQLKKLLDSTHPEPSFTMNLDQVKSHIDRLSKEVTTPMSQREAWLYMAELNGFFNDGHMAIFYPSLNKEFNLHSFNGGQTFPIKVRIDNANRVYVHTNEYEKFGIRSGDEIKMINGISATEIANDIVIRMHGDSLKHRLALAADRFAKMYWFMYGDSGNYKIEIKNNKNKSSHIIAGKRELIDKEQPTLDKFVQRAILEHNIGYLRIDRFYYAPYHEDAFFQFMEDSWHEFKQAKVQDVIIDVRSNPGGTDHYWHQGIAPNVATEDFAFFSKLKIRLTKRNLKLGPVTGELGAIHEVPYEKLIPVSGKEGLKIPGQAYLLMGPLSYSSTVLFLTAFQDAKQAVIAGEHTGVRSCTTGRIHPFELNNSKLEITVPTAIFIRSAGSEQCNQAIEPDITLSSSDALAELVAIIAGE